MQLRVLGHPGLHEDDGGARVDTRSEPVDHHVEGVLLDVAGILVAGRQRVPVRHEEEAFVAVLQLEPVPDDAVIMAQVQPAGRTHPREYPVTRLVTAQRSLSTTY